MDTTIQCKNLYKAKHHAEAYHAGDKGRTIDQVSKGYLLAKYPLVEEYRFFVQGKYCLEVVSKEKEGRWLMLSSSGLLGEGIRSCH